MSCEYDVGQPCRGEGDPPTLPGPCTPNPSPPLLSRAGTTSPPRIPFPARWELRGDAPPSGLGAFGGGEKGLEARCRSAAGLKTQGRNAGPGCPGWGLSHSPLPAGARSRPGQEGSWEEVAGAAAKPGEIWDSGMGWPAARVPMGLGGGPRVPPVSWLGRI